MTDKSPVLFLFDFTSPYSYLVAEKIDDLAAKYGRKVIWKPVMLGPLFKVTGSRPLVEVPLRGPYSILDFARSARFHGIPYRQPSKFPLITLATARAYYWLHDRDCGVRPLAAEGAPRSGGVAAASGMPTPDLDATAVEDAEYSGVARKYARAAFRACFTEDRDISDPAVVVELAAAQGANAEELAAALGTQEVKDRLKRECDAAIARGMFGAPYVVIDDEPFWGADRLPQIEKWLETGGF